MANFAKIGLSNVVLNIVSMSNLETMTEGGVLDGSIGIEKLSNQTGHETWLLCGNDLTGNVIRKNLPSTGWFYSEEYDGFYSPRPVDINGNVCNSWTLNGETCLWEPPIVQPDSYFADGDRHEVVYHWNETAYQEDNTTGWEAIT